MTAQRLRPRPGSGGTYRDLPVWRATCRGGTVWTIVVGNDGVASVLNPNEATPIENEIGSAPANAQQAERSDQRSTQR